MQLTEAYSFKWKRFAKVYMFELGDFGFVLEKDLKAVCLYVTNKMHTDIYAAMPICVSKVVKKVTFEFLPIGTSCCSFVVPQIDFKFFVDFERKCCAHNSDMKIFGSEQWGDKPQVKWNEWV